MANVEVKDPGPPSGIVVFLFTDIEGSTARWESNPEAMRAAVRRHDELLRSTLLAHRGFVFKTIGDAFCVAFDFALDALHAALAAQRALCGENFDAVDGLRVRMALHAGGTDERDGDYFGPAVNRVARLLSAAYGRQVLNAVLRFGGCPRSDRSARADAIDARCRVPGKCREPMRRKIVVPDRSVNT